MINLEMLNHLATSVLNTNERFIPIKGDLSVELTEAGLDQLAEAWFQLDDAGYHLTMDTFTDVLEKMLLDSDTVETLTVVDQPHECSLVSLLELALIQTFQMYHSTGEFYEFVTLESYDFEYLAKHYFLANDFNLTTFKLDFDDLQATLDCFIEFKGYDFMKNQFVPASRS